MRPHEYRVVLLIGSLCVYLCAFSSPCWGQYDVEQEPPVWVRGLLDVRVARGGRASSWTDQGRGVGKARYGGRSTSDGEERVTRLVVSQLALEVGATLPWDIVARAQVNAETDLDHDRPLLIHAFLRKEGGEWQSGWGLQMGVMNIPFSLEHAGPAATPRYTLTPSALNTWLWEEVRVIGIEAEWWQVMMGGWRLGILAGSGFGPDQMGRLLAGRGWVLSDYLSGINSDLPLSEPDAVSVFDERDYRPAMYTRLMLSEPQDRAQISVGYFDNLGDLGTTGVWETRFGTAGVILHPLANLDLLVQYMGGQAQSRAVECNIHFQALYVLLSYHYHGHRFSVRYDDFWLDDIDGRPPTYRERGDAVTLAYLFEFSLRHRIGIEYMFAHSRRVTPVRGDPSDSGWQISYRFRY